jgi:hypothetical protein
MYGFNFVKSSVIVDDLCYLNVTINIPLIDYSKTLKVFSYLTENFQEDNEEKMFLKIIELFPKDNETFEKQLGALERIMHLKLTAYQEIKEADNADNVEHDYQTINKINHLLKHNKLANGSLKEIKHHFDKVK